MRLFVAIELPPAVKEQLAALKTDLPGATWVKPPALHLTLRFLGDHLDPIRLTPIKTALGSINAAPFTLTLRGTGRFPSGNKRPPRVLWVGVDDQPALLALQAAVEQVLGEVGFPPDDHAYSPHITLARLKEDGAAAQVGRLIEQHQAFRAPPFTVNEFFLVASLLTPQGPNYHHEASFPLEAV